MKKEIICQVCHRTVNTVEDDNYSVEYITCFNCDDSSMKIKISQAMKLARECGLDKVLIFGINKEGSTVTTFGESFEDSNAIATVGNWFKRQLGWPEIYCNDKPIRNKK